MKVSLKRKLFTVLGVVTALVGIGSPGTIEIRYWEIAPFIFSVWIVKSLIQNQKTKSFSLTDSFIVLCIMIIRNICLFYWGDREFSHVTEDDEYHYSFSEVEYLTALIKDSAKILAICLYWNLWSLIYHKIVNYLNACDRHEKNVCNFYHLDWNVIVGAPDMNFVDCGDYEMKDKLKERISKKFENEKRPDIIGELGLYALTTDHRYNDSYNYVRFRIELVNEIYTPILSDKMSERDFVFLLHSVLGERYYLGEKSDTCRCVLKGNAEEVVSKWESLFTIGQLLFSFPQKEWEIINTERRCNYQEPIPKWWSD